LNKSAFPAFHEAELTFSGGEKTRRISVFLPPGFGAGAESCPVVYCSDGGAVAAFGMRLTRSMQAGLVPATVLVGVHNSPDSRAEEYLPGVSQQRFDAHADFFANNVIDWTRRELGVPAESQSTAVFGVSNGGAFAVAMGFLHPEKFGHVIAFSVAKSPTRLAFPSPRPESFPRFYLAAGKTGRENSFRRHTAALAKYLGRHNIECTFSARDGGHDFEFWQSELPAAFNWAFAL
jgi:enterochelin esterase-like enzyme